MELRCCGRDEEIVVVSMQTDAAELHQVLCRLFDDLVWWKADEYSCSSCLACSDILLELEWLMVDESDVRDDDGLSILCVSDDPTLIGRLVACADRVESVPVEAGNL